MTVCSFLGQRHLLDADLYPRMVNTIETLLKQHDDMDFWFHDQNAFTDIGLRAVLAVRSRYPQKHITITYVASAPFNKKKIPFPDCLIDRVVVAPHALSDKGDSLHRWVIQQSDYLIRYVYPVLREHVHTLSAFAEKQPVVVCDVTNPDTAAFIRESVDKLKENERNVIQKREEGYSKKEIMSQLGLTRWKMEEAFRTGLQRLYWIAEQRESRARPCLPTTCGIFSLGKGDLYTAMHFQRMLGWMDSRWGLRRFFLDASCATAAEISHLVYTVKTYYKYHVTVVTHAPQAMAQTEKERIAAQMIPPFHDVLNIDPCAQTIRAQTLRTIKEIMRRCDICLCNLSNAVFADSIKRFAPQAHTILIDIGHPPYTIIAAAQLEDK